jgi:hypothetical protein
MLRRPYRTILRREQDSDGTVTWIAEVADMPWCRGVGTTRLEALRAVAAMMKPRVPERGQTATGPAPPPG